MPSLPIGPVETIIRLLPILVVVFLIGGVVGLAYQRVKKALH